MTVDIEKLKALALAATSGPWEVDTVKSEGHYGTDEDGGYGFMGYAIIDEEGRPLMDSLNRDQSDIHEDYDGEEHYAWDELAKRDAMFIAAANPAAVLELIAEVERLRAESARYRWLRDKANDERSRAPMVFNCHPEDVISWTDSLHGANLDAVLDVFVDAAIEKEKA
jgi:hypothetical protein